MTKDEKWLLGLAIFAVVICSVCGVLMVIERNIGFAAIDFLFVAVNILTIVRILSEKYDKR